jgi:hypothetical protein
MPVPAWPLAAAYLLSVAVLAVAGRGAGTLHRLRVVLAGAARAVVLDAGVCVAVTLAPGGQSDGRRGSND